MINVADIVSDPDFTQPVTRIVRIESINQYGESVIESRPTAIQAIVTSPNSQELLMFPDATAYRDIIRVTTASRLNADSVGLQPDLIVYHGENYKVTVTNDYSDYGYTRALCGLIDLQDQPN
jgi:hypothetical protein